MQLKKLRLWRLRKNNLKEQINSSYKLLKNVIILKVSWFEVINKLKEMILNLKGVKHGKKRKRAKITRRNNLVCCW